MFKLYPIIFLLALLGLTACSSWPFKGLGGMAEHHQQTLYPVFQLGKPLGPEHGLRFDLELTSRHLDILALKGAELCFPATVIQAKQRQNRISRELQGGLKYDAANDIIIQRSLLARLERQLDYVKKNDVCVLPIINNTPIKKDEKKSNSNTPSKPSNDKKVGKKAKATSKYISDLLNVDNQFAIGSSALNPKYLNRLAEAVKLLRNVPDYNLLIMGHADITGTENRNRQLSMDRAVQVGRYLKILGFPEDRLQIDSVGSANPLFKSTDPYIRLVNRHISIEMTDVNPSLVKARK